MNDKTILFLKSLADLLEVHDVEIISSGLGQNASVDVDLYDLSDLSEISLHSCYTSFAMNADKIRDIIKEEEGK